MKPRRQAAAFDAASARPEVFMALDHALSIRCVAHGRWTVSVDGGPALVTYGTQGEAWEAGVREIAARDRLIPLPVG